MYQERFDKESIIGDIMSHYRDLQISLVLVILTIISVYYNIEKIRTVLGLLFILFFPGYSLIAALFPRKEDIDGIERLALSFGLSIAVVPLIGLGLNYTPWGIRLNPILISISLFTILCLTAAFLRRVRLPEDERFFVEMPETEIFSGSKIDKILSALLIISIIAALVTLVYVIVTPKVGEKFTEFYILGLEGKAADYPTEYKIGESKEVIMGVVNHEYEEVEYTFKLKLQGNILYEESFILNHEEKLEKKIEIKPDTTGENMKLQFLLFKNGEQYRDLHLWINVTE